MKRTFITLSIVLAAMGLNAQTDWGVKAGGGLADISVFNGSGTESYAAKATYFAGAYMRKEFTRHSGMNAELIYIDKGAKSGTTIHLHYVNIPVLFTYLFAGGRMRVEGGPEAGYLISAYNNGSANDFWSNKLDLSLDFGVACNITPKINVGTRTNYGLFDVANVTIRDNNNSRVGEVDYRNRTVQFYLAYCITCNKKVTW
jgi:hypothetical protein